MRADMPLRRRKSKTATIPRNALIAWGNALEDLAFYLLTDPERNYGNAEEKFLAAFNSLPDFLRERKGLLPLTGLLRCRIRLAQSNVLGNPHKEKEILEEAVRDAEDKGRSLVLVSKEPAGVNRRAMRDVLQKTQAAQFQLFLAIAHREIAERGSAEERTENLRKSTAALEWASRLADGLASGNWAAIQREWREPKIWPAIRLQGESTLKTCSTRKATERNPSPTTI